MTPQIIITLNLIILFYFLVVNACYAILLLFSIPEIIKRYKRQFVRQIFQTGVNVNAPRVTVIISAYNEEKRILDCIQSVFNSDYKNINILIINDGSEDGTLKLLMRRYNLHSHVPLIDAEVYQSHGVKRYYLSKSHPNLSVLDKEHSGVGNSFNVGLRIAKTSFVMTLDADSILEPEAITNLMYAMLNDKNVVMVGGAVYILNGCEYTNGSITKARLPRTLVAALQSSEYIRSFIFGRTGWNLLKGPLSLSGTSTLLDRKLALEMGGFDTNNPAQDAEIVVHQHQLMGRKRKKYKVVYTPSAFSWTIVPDTFKSYAKQRVKWQWGFTRSFLKHLSMFLNPRYGVVGLFSYPFYLLVETFGPIVEFTAYCLILITLALGVFDYKSALIFILLAWGFLSFITFATMLMNLVTFNKYRKMSDIWKLFLLVIVEMFGFRQFLITLRTWGAIKYFLFPKLRK